MVAMDGDEDVLPDGERVGAETNFEDHSIREPLGVTLPRRREICWDARLPRRRE